MRLSRSAALRLVVIVFFAAVAASAQQHPNKEKGFDPKRLYDFHALDDINTFNGNLIVTIPLGQRYQVNANLSYGLNLVYNGVVWDATGDLADNPDPAMLAARSSIRSNAGNGWLVSFGRLFAPSDPMHYPALMSGGQEDRDNWVYESADGRDHLFAPTSPSVVKNESSLIRMRLDTASGDRWIEFPDGTYQVFHNFGGPGDGIWRLTATKDRFGNGVYIDYLVGSGTTSGNQPYDERWIVKQYANGDSPASSQTPVRTQALFFDHPDGATDGQTLLRQINLETCRTEPGTSRYQSILFDYGAGPSAIGRPLWDRSICTSTSQETSCSRSTALYSMFLLRSVTFEASNESYSFVYGEGAGSDISNAALTKLTVPTGGSIGWTYQAWSFPRYINDRTPQVGGGSVTPPAYRDENAAVDTRTLAAQDGSVLGIWSYKRKYSTPVKIFNVPDGHGQEVTEIFHHQMAVAVTEPDGTTAVHYYSVYKDDGAYTVPSGWEWSNDEYALALTHWVPPVVGADGGKLYFSTEVRKNFTDIAVMSETGARASGSNASDANVLRSTFVRYGLTPIANGPVTTTELASRTVYDQDQSCNAAVCYRESFNRNWDTYGHFKQVSTYANFGHDGLSAPSNTRTTFTNYTPPGDVWILNDYTEQCAAEDAAFNSGTITSCAGLTGSKKATERFCFSSATGFLQRRWTLQGATPQAGDVVVEQDPERPPGSSRSNGNIAEERNYLAPDIAAGSDLCTADLGSPQYSTSNRYDFGILKTSQSAGLSFFSVDRTIDPGTGLTVASRDPAGLETRYDYDLAGRLTSVAAPGTVPITYAYHPYASSTGALAYVEVTQDGSSMTPMGTQPYGRTYSIFDFDSMGRVVRTRNLTADEKTSAQSTEYDAMGRPLRESAVEEYTAGWTPSHIRSFLYDHFARVRQTTNFDGSVITADWTGEGIHRMERTAPIYTGDAADTVVPAVELYDTNDKLLQVEEKSGPTSATNRDGAVVKTRYGYDVAGRLTTVDMAGSESATPQHREFTYDNRGFLLHEQHPEIGTLGNRTIDYGEYDARGHAHRRITGPVYGAFDLQFVYDQAERLIEVNHVTGATSTENVKTFQFADANEGSNFKQGKLERAIRHNRLAGTGDVVVTETYFYAEPGGRVSHRDTSIATNGITRQTFSQDFPRYSPWGQLERVGYPACITVACAPPSLPSGVSLTGNADTLFHNGVPVGVSGWAGFTYEANGFLRQITHQGAVSQLDTRESDSTHGMPRPARISFSGYCSGPNIAAQEPADQIQSSALVPLSITPPNGAVSYQWYQIGANGPVALPGETSSSYRPPFLQSAARYFVRVTDAEGCPSDSRVATVTVPCAGVDVTEWPHDTAVGNDQTATFNLVTTSTGVIIEWFAGPRGDGGALIYTGATFHTPPLSSSTYYWVRVRTADGSCVLPGPTIQATLCPPLVMVSPPAGATKELTAGTTATLSASVTVSGGLPPYTFVWRNSQTNAVLQTDNNSLVPASTYQVSLTAGNTLPVAVTASDSCGHSAPSPAVELKTTIKTAAQSCPTLLYFGPTYATVAQAGQGIQLSVRYDRPDLVTSYQWYRGDGTPITGATHAELDTTTYSFSSYYVKVLTPCGEIVTDKAYIKVYGTCPLEPVSITPNQVSLGDDTESTVLFAMTDWPFVTYDWYRGEVGNTRERVASVPGHANQLRVSRIAATYWVRITSECGERLDSDLAIVSVSGAGACDPVIIRRTADDAVVASGDAVRLFIDANSLSTLSYAWYRLEGATPAAVPGGSQASVIAPVYKSGLYWATATNTCGATTTSRTINIRVASCGANHFTTDLPDTILADNTHAIQATVAVANPAEVQSIRWFTGGDAGDPRSTDTGVTGATFSQVVSASTKLWARVTTTGNCSFDSRATFVDVCVKPDVLDSNPQYVNIVPGEYTYLQYRYAGTGLDFDWYMGDPSADRATWQPMNMHTDAIQVHPLTTTQYFVEVTNRCDYDISPPYIVSLCPAITELTASATTVMPNTPVQLHVAGDGNLMSYRWYKGSVGDVSTLLASTADYLTDPLAQSTTFWAAASSGSCTTPSAAINVTVCAPLGIAWAPDIVTNVRKGQSQSISVTGVPAAAMTTFYQGTAGDVAHSTILAGPSANQALPVAPNSTTTYWARVTAANGICYSDTTALTLNVCVPQITAQPQAQMINAGGTAHLSVNADITPVTYQWYSGTGTLLTGKTAATLDISPSVNTSYWVRVTGSCSGFVDSQPAMVTICQTPAITAPPISILANPPNGGDFSLTATGTSLSYQWYLGSAGTTTNPVGTNAPTLHVTPSQTTNYWVKVTGACGTASSGTVVASVCPSITQQPTAASPWVQPNGTTTLTVAASGAALSYQWYAGSPGNTAQPVGTDSPSYPTASLAQTTTYWVAVTSGICTVPSSAVTVNVCSLSASWNAASTQVTSGYSQSVSVSAPAGMNVTFYRGTVSNIAASTLIQGPSASYSLSIAPTATTTYWARVTNPSTGCYTDTAGLTVSVCVPQITTQPQSQMINAGSNVTLSVATNVTPATYQWYSGSSTLLSGQTASTLTVSPSSATSYWVRVTGSCTSFVDSQPATITICQTPNITAHPVSPSAVPPGGSSSLQVQATGTSLTYQWYTGASGNTASPVSGGTSATLTRTVNSTEQYWVRVSGACGSAANSNSAWMSVTPSILTHPSNAAINPGSTVHLSVVASGSYLTYQWYQGDIGHPVGTNSPAFDSPALFTDTTYFVIVRSGTGSATSASASITMCTGPQIDVGPYVQFLGGSCKNVGVTVSENDRGTAAYQWYRGQRGDVSTPVGSNYYFQTCSTTPTTYWVRITNVETGCYTDSDAVNVN